ncbi:hypothetical protein FJZ27_00290 [Candidatus Peribacteria bacterium]|nr:hypothetical protein [Candidatus Peribacteria bacterium]
MTELSHNNDQERKAEDAQIGPLIVRLAEEKGLDLEKAANLSPEYVGGMRDGKRELSNWAIVRCARVLELSNVPAIGVQGPELSVAVARIRSYLLQLLDSK